MILSGKVGLLSNKNEKIKKIINSKDFLSQIEN